MAFYKEMIPNKPIPAEIETPFTASGYRDGRFTLCIGPLCIALTRGERDAAIHTWKQLENGIDPETSKPFNPRKLELMAIELQRLLTPEEYEEILSLSAPFAETQAEK